IGREVRVYLEVGARLDLPGPPGEGRSGNLRDGALQAQRSRPHIDAAAVAEGRADGGGAAAGRLLQSALVGEGGGGSGRVPVGVGLDVQGGPRLVDEGTGVLLVDGA